MKYLNKISKIFAYLTVLFGALWLGGYLLRLILTYQIFEGTDLHFKDYIAESNLNVIYIILNSAVTFAFITYIIFILSYISFISFSKLSLKKHGWLFIISLIILVTLPFELYLMTIDYKIFTVVYEGNFIAEDISKLMIERMKVFSSFPLIEIFCYFSIIYFMIFKPFTVKEK
jgi:hypothetical protein